MAAFEQQAPGLFDQTIQAFNGDVTAVSPLDGVTLIDNWISALNSKDEKANPIADSLSALKSELQKGNPSTTEISTILKALTDQARDAAKSADTGSGMQPRLNALVDALSSFNQQITGQVGPANTGGRAALTSTVGGDSSLSGAGNVSSGSTMDDPTGSDGGDQPGTNPQTGTTATGSPRSGRDYGVSSAPGSDMAGSSQTGSGSIGGDNYGQTGDAGNTQGGGSYGSGYGTGSTFEAGTPNSGTDMNTSNLSGSERSYMDDPAGTDGDMEPERAAGISPTTGSSSGMTDIGENRSGAAYGTTIPEDDSTGTGKTATVDMGGDTPGISNQPDAGNTQGGGSYGSGYGTGSTAEEGTSNSGTDNNMGGGRIGGGSISGGQSDSELGGSGGRSS